MKPQTVHTMRGEERAKRQIVRQPIGVHARAVMTMAGVAVDEQVSAAMAAYVAHGALRGTIELIVS
jgi:hypothetical protein